MGDAREAWVVDYVDQHGKRRLKTFRLQREAKAFSATTATVEIGCIRRTGQCHGRGRRVAVFKRTCDMRAASLCRLTRRSGLSPFLLLIECFDAS